MSLRDRHSRRATDLSVSAKRRSGHAPARSITAHPIASASNDNVSTGALSRARLLWSPVWLVLALLLAPVAPVALALDNTTIRPRTVYQVLTDRFARTDNSYSASCGARNYCGGTWRGLIAHLDYIQGMGFDTVWISPIVDNIEGYTQWGEAYHGYWTRDPTKLNSHFGTKDDLLALSSALHSRGMYLMVDIVVNHVATTQPGASFNPGTSYGPFTSQDDFHQPFCYIDYSSQSSIETCALGDAYVPLPDINTEKPSVVAFWNDWIRSTVQTYAIDAIRIDTVKHIRQSFWPAFTSSAGVFNFGEVFDGNPSYVAAYQNNGVNPLNYPVWWPLVRAFQQVGGNLNDLVWNVGQVQGMFKDVGLLGGFVNNHDNPRFEGLTQDPALRKNIHAFPFVTDGVPIVYYGSEAGYSGGADPDNREPFWPTRFRTDMPLYSLFVNLNAARRAAGKQSGFYTSKTSMSVLGSNEVLIVKKPLVSILSNRGASASSVSYTLKAGTTGWKPNMAVRDAISSKGYTTDGHGDLMVTVVNGEPLVLLDATLKP